jgi:hypothetical protein
MIIKRIRVSLDDKQVPFWWVNDERYKFLSVLFKREIICKI